MSAFGYIGKILHVDLSSEQFEIKNLDLDAARDYLGGLGLNAWLMEQTYLSGTDPLSPDNPIILGAGPLVATGTPGAENKPLILRDYFGQTELSKEDISRLVEDYYDERGWRGKGLV